MTITELAAGLNALYPTRYSHFTSKQATPFITYMDYGNNPLVAENKNIVEATEVRIELYCDNKNLIAENKIKSFLNENDLPYDQEQTFFIEYEKLFLSVFNIEII